MVLAFLLRAIHQWRVYYYFKPSCPQSLTPVNALMRSQRQLPAKPFSESVKAYGPPIFGIVMSLYIYGLWISCLNAVVTGSAGLYSLPWIVFISYLVWEISPLFIHSCVHFYLLRHIAERDYEALDRVYSKTLKLINSLHLKHAGVRTFLLSEVGRMRLLEGQFDSAENYFLEAIESTAKNARYPRISKAILHFNCGGTLRRQGLLDAAGERYEIGMQLLQSSDPKTLAFLAFANLSVAALKIDQNDLEGAEQCLRQSKKLMDRTDLQAAFPAVRKVQAETSCLNALTLVLLRKGELAGAESLGENFLALAYQHVGEISSMELRTLNLVAAEYLALGKPELAEPFLDLAYLVARDFQFHPDSQLTLDNFEKLLITTERKDEVPDMRQWLRPVDLNPIALS
jgi:tetratricopeptide (TPR) repeat protein